MTHFRFKDSSATLTTSWPQGAETSTHPGQLDLMEENAHLRRLLAELKDAVLDAGTNKAHHMKMLVRHRTEWPYLWEKIDAVLRHETEADTN